MNVLVTGGAGYIGSHTCVELLEKGYGVVVIDNLVNSSAKSLERVEQITGKSLDFYQNDVRDRDAMERIFSKHDIDCVIHFAGLKAVGESVAMPLEYYDNNLYSTVVLCETMREHGVKNIVFSSSATVYSGDNTMPLRENSHTGMCTNPYGWTKYMCEQILRDTGKAIADYITVHDETVDDTKGLTIFDPMATWKRKDVYNFEARELLVPIFKNGKRVYDCPPLEEIKAYCAQQVDTLWDEVKRFDYPHKYYVDLSDKLWDIQQCLLRTSQM